MKPLILAAIWLMLMGVWPFANPHHAGDTPTSILDLALHALGAGFIVHYWWTGRFPRRLHDDPHRDGRGPQDQA